MENSTIPQTTEELLIAQARIALVWMYGTPEERDGALRVFARLVGEYRKVVESRDEAQGHARALVHEMDEMSREIDGLRGEIAQLLGERDRALDQLEAVDAVAQEAVDERNAARREVCRKLSLMNPDLSPQEIARRRGWTCWDGWTETHPD